MPISLFPIGELLFLLTGIYITYCIRNAKKEIYREKWTLSWSLYIETVVSFTTYVLRHCFVSQLHPDYIFLLYMLRCHFTVTIVLIILFGPKVRRRTELNDTEST